MENVPAFSTQEMWNVEATEQGHAPNVPAVNKAFMSLTLIGATAIVSGAEVLAVLIINVLGSFSTLVM